MKIYIIANVLLLCSLIVLCGIPLWNNDKFVAAVAKVYNRFCDRVGYIAAMIYIKYRKCKIGIAVCCIEKALAILDKEESYPKKGEGWKCQTDGKKD